MLQDEGRSYLSSGFQSFIPPAVIRKVASGKDFIPNPTVDVCEGAALFVDVSGYSSLATELASFGPQGAEQLWDLLNPYFVALLAVIGEHGGEVVKFAGDALLAVWRTDELEYPSVRDATEAASACALALTQVDSGAVDSPRRLLAHVGVGAGNLLSLFVGGVGGDWKFLEAGHAVVDAAVAAATAGPGVVAISRIAWAELATRAVGTEIDTHNRRLTELASTVVVRAVAPVAVPAAFAPSLAPFVPLPIASRLEAGHHSWLAELRRCTLLFIQLKDLDTTTPSCVEQLSAGVGAVQHASERYGGWINQILVDDKGAVVVVVFGVAPAAHEDDPDRAVLTAMNIQEQLRTLEQDVRIGVATGPTFAGPVGSDIRRDYMVLGDAVNVAARLMSASPGPCLCDSSTAALATTIDFIEVGPLTLKGLDAPIGVWHPVARNMSERYSHTTPMPLAGRRDEQRVMRDALDRAAAHEGFTICLEGDPGMGKTRLLSLLAATASQSGLPVLFGSGDAVDASTAYFAWRGVLNQLFERTDVTPPSLSLVEKRVIAAGHPTDMAPLLNQFLGTDYPDSDTTRAMAGERRAYATSRLVGALISNWAGDGEGRGALLVLDDGHWLDSNSWRLVGHIRSLLPRLVMVVAYRPFDEGQPLELERLRAQRQAECISLEGLSEEEVAVLLANVLSAAHVDSEVARFVHSRADGNPFYCTELGLVLRDEGVVIIDGGRCRFAKGAEATMTAVPATLEGVVTSRIDRLPAAHQLTVKVASVIGRAFEYQTLRDAHPVAAEQEQLGEQLIELERRRLTQLDPHEAELTYLFTHVITQQVAYSLLLFADRARLHARVAELIESHHADDLAPFLPSLAFHWERAGEPVRAVPYLAAAGKNAVRSGGYREALRFLDRARELDGPPRDDAQRRRHGSWNSLAAEATLGVGDMPGARARAEEAIRLLGVPMPIGPLRIAADIVRQLPFVVGGRGAFAPSDDQSRETAIDLTRAFYQAAEATYLELDFLPFFWVVLRGIRSAEEAGNSSETARNYSALAVLLSSARLVGPGRRLIQRARRIAGTNADDFTIGWITLLEALTLMSASDIGQARKQLIVAGQHLGRAGELRTLTDALSTRGVLEWACGDRYALKELSPQIAALAGLTGDRQHRAMTATVNAVASTLAGDWQGAVDVLEGPLADDSDKIGVVASAPAFALSALAHIHLGDTERTLDEMSVALRQITQSPAALVLAYGAYTTTAEVALLAVQQAKSAYQETQARRAAKVAMRVVRQFAFLLPIGRPAAARLRGQAAMLDSHMEVARRHWRNAIGLARRYGIALEEARARSFLARALPPGPEREKQVVTALDIFDSVGADWERSQLSGKAQ